MSSSDTETTMNSTPIPTEPPAPVKGQKFGKGIRQPSHTIAEKDRQLIVSLWASGLTTSEVQERVLEDHNIKVSYAQILLYTKSAKWQPLIQRIKKETYADLASVAGSHKKVRLNRAERIYEKAMSGSKPKLKEALAATEHQRKEMEGGGDFNITMNQFNLLSDEELEAKKMEVMQRIANANKRGVITLEQPTDKTEATGA